MANENQLKLDRIEQIEGAPEGNGFGFLAGEKVEVYPKSKFFSGDEAAHDDFIEVISDNWQGVPVVTGTREHVRLA
jgi:hypothetical protein